MKLFVLSGLPGSGKTSLAITLHGAFDSKLICRDVLRKQHPLLDEVGLTTMTKMYALDLLKHQQSVIIDAPNHLPSDKTLWESIAEETGADLIWIEMRTDIKECIIRDASRPHPVGEVKIRAMAAGKL